MWDLLDKISIIIVNWNGKKFLSGCLDGLRQQIYQPLSITLIDNGSNDGSIDFVTHNYPEVKTIALPKNIGFSAESNIALKTLQTRHLALLDNDAMLYHIWAKSLVEVSSLIRRWNYYSEKSKSHFDSKYFSKDSWALNNILE